MVVRQTKQCMYNKNLLPKNNQAILDFLSDRKKMGCRVSEWFAETE
jgi:hypothetical protein